MAIQVDQNQYVYANLDSKIFLCHFTKILSCIKSLKLVIDKTTSFVL